MHILKQEKFATCSSEIMSTKNLKKKTNYETVTGTVVTDINQITLNNMQIQILAKVNGKTDIKLFHVQ